LPALEGVIKIRKKNSRIFPEDIRKLIYLFLKFFKYRNLETKHPFHPERLGPLNLSYISPSIQSMHFPIGR
jgi:hypothetical protein